MIISFTTYIAEQIISEVVLFAKFFENYMLGMGVGRFHSQNFEIQKIESS